MLSYLEYLKWAGGGVTAFVIVLFLMQIIGEVMEFYGKTAPKIMKVFKSIRERHKQKRKERQALHELPCKLVLLDQIISNDSFKNLPDKLSQLDRIYTLLDTVEQHYSADNITKRDKWMNWVNSRAEVYDSAVGELTSLKEALQANNSLTIDMYITICRNRILEFASKVANENVLISREEFSQIFTIHENYEKELKKNNMKNGQVDIAYKVIEDAYAERLKDQKFLEDVRGYM